MPAWVLLRHNLPDGSWHYDWMLEPPFPSPRPGSPGGEPPATLTTFRLTQRPDDPAVTSLIAHELPGHRRAFLEYEGPVSQGRGTVTRVTSGTYRSIAHDHDHLELVLEAPPTGPDRDRRWFGRRDPMSALVWSFRLLEPPT